MNKQNPVPEMRQIPDPRHREMKIMILSRTAGLTESLSKS